jgi:hypothetical protein
MLRKRNKVIKSTDFYQSPVKKEFIHMESQKRMKEKREILVNLNLVLTGFSL